MKHRNREGQTKAQTRGGQANHKKQEEANETHKQVVGTVKWTGGGMEKRTRGRE